MGLLDILAAGYLAKRANNKLNPPIIGSPEGCYSDRSCGKRHE